MPTRIKICGLTRPEDVDAAVAAGADAIGFVFYPQSPRHVTPGQAAALVRRLPPFVLAVGLFVNEEAARIQAILDQVPLNLLQFHGDEGPEDCARWGRPWIRAARVRPGLDLLQYAARFSGARALLLDAFVEGYGGGGHVFDWRLIPPDLPLPLILSGGLSPENVADAVRRVRPAAVDVSSGVEAGKGIKDHQRMADFVAAVRAADRD
ncbi:phosphoribosylanthranilate isomerase [Azovibrio restrictus]|uniref:phosphoribosylanthranilate isomerase n=1 Tax=Azovibrio restrictus TaxID=146938 RepID=UPI0026F0FF98|nr:phosphoribosylanthranilate isomerase [Azovibrio restrictus]